MGDAGRRGACGGYNYPTNANETAWPAAPCCGFGGSLGWADDAATAPTSREVCACWKQGGADLAWEPMLPQRFDNVPMAMLTLFECSTTEGWIDVMFAAIDTNALDMQPVRGSQPQWALFFIFFMLFGGYFVVNLFVGVLLSNFKEKKNQKVDEEKTQREWQRLVEGLVAVVGNEVTEKAKQIFEVLDEDGSGGLDADEPRTGLRKLGQKNVTRAEADAMIAELDHDGNGAIDIDEFLTIVHDLSQDMEGNWLEEWLAESQSKGDRPEGAPVRAFAWDVATSRPFENTILSCVVANTMVMASQHFGQPDWFTQASQRANFAFAMIFNAEAVLKLFALRATYFGVSDAFGRFTVNRWNCFDLIIVVGTDIGIATKLATGEDSVGSIGLVVRACRIGRRAAPHALGAGHEELFDTLMHTLPGMMNVGGLLCLICFIYAAVGVQLFSRVAYHGALDPHCNFRTFFRRARRAVALRDRRKRERLYATSITSRTAATRTRSTTTRYAASRATFRASASTRPTAARSTAAARRSHCRTLSASCSSCPSCS